MRISIFSTIAIGLFSLAGCEALKPQTYGEVSVGRPQVFSRERLLTERLGEVNWLRGQLDREFEQGFQGVRDIREASAFVFQLQVKYDLAKKRAESLQSDDATKKRVRDQELADLQHDIDKARLQQQLDKVRQDTASVPPNSSVPDSLKGDLAKLDTSIQAIQTKLADIEKRLVPQKVTADAAGVLDDPTAKLANPNLAEKTIAQAASRDRLEDEAAYRDFVNGRIREKMLDDTHDMSGFVLYELKFDASVVPGDHTIAKALAELKVIAPKFEDVKLGDSFYERLRHRAQEDSNLLLARLNERLRAGKMSNAWMQRIRGFIPDEKSSVCQTESKNSSFVTLSRQLNSKSIPKPSEVALGQCLIASYIRFRLSSALGKYFNIVVVHRSDTFEDLPVLTPLLLVAKTDQGLKELKVKIGQLEDRMKIWVATVEPKEYAQNISDVSSLQKVRQIGLTLGATNGQGLDLETAASSYKKELTLLQAIKRQPLATSFARGDGNFGWILGPKFEIKGEKPIFVHSTARYVFTASVVVPGWFSAIELKGCNHWIDSNGVRSVSTGLFGATCNDKITVNLPHSHRPLLHALMDSQQDIFNDPEIYLLAQNDDQVNKNSNSGIVTLRGTPDACIGSNDKACEQQLVIEGRELWRNPVVYVGNQAADRVELLPSMRGIVATFKNLRMPPTRPGMPIAPQDILVSTSVGQDRLADSVFIAPPVQTTLQPFARLERPYLERIGAEPVVVTFLYAPSAFPRAYAAVSARVRKVGDTQWKSIEESPTFEIGKLSFTPDPTKLGFGDKSTDMEFDLLFKFLPTDDWMSMIQPSARFATYYASKNERELALASSATLDFSASQAFGGKEIEKLREGLRVSLPKDEALFFKAYPGLESALSDRGGTVRIRLRIDEDDDPIELTAERVDVKGKKLIQPKTVAVSNKDRELVPIEPGQLKYRMSVTYRRGAGEWIEVPMSAERVVTIIGRKKPPISTKKETEPKSPVDG